MRGFRSQSWRAALDCRRQASGTGCDVWRIPASSGGYSAIIDPARLAFGLTILIRARPLPGQLPKMLKAIDKTPQIVSFARVSGKDCFVARAHVHDVTEMEKVIDRLVPRGATNSTVVQSNPVPPRLPDI